jgi:hypothetical protein
MADSISFFRKLLIQHGWQHLILYSLWLWTQKFFFFFFWHCSPWWNLASSKLALKHLALNFRSYSKEHIFYGMGLAAPCPTPNLKHQNIPLCLGHHFDLHGMRYPTNFYTTTSIALRIIWPCTLHHYIKVGKVTVTMRNMSPSDSAIPAILLPHQENVLLSIVM